MQEYPTCLRRSVGMNSRTRGLLGRPRNGPCQYYLYNKSMLTTRGRLIFETKSCFACADGDSSSNFNDIMIKRLPYIVEIGEDECFAHVESHSNDIFCILMGESLDVGNC